MIRVVLFLVALALIAVGFAWIADRPGDVTVTWIGYRIETSVMVATLAVVAAVLLISLLWGTLRGIFRSPEQVSLFFRHRRAVRGYLALSRGLIAVGSGDQKLARKSADEAAKLSPGDPLTLLLTAQSAQMAGDRDGAERAFRDMMKRDDTKLLGLRGLYIEAQRRGDPHAARLVAEEAAKIAPSLAWAGQAVLDNCCANGDWAGALNALEHMKHALAKADYRRKRAVLLTARAQALEDSDRDAARAAVLEAVKLAPDLVPAAALAGRRLAESNEQRKAARILETAWAANPHPDIAEAYANLRFGDTARERFARVQRLAAKSPGEREGAIAVARAALDAGEFKSARDALAPYLDAPTRRVAALMAEIEQAERGDTGRVREWMARAMRASGDPAWTADGVVSEHWLPVTPGGRLDGFVWKVPLAEIGMRPPVIEMPPPAEAAAQPATASEDHSAAEPAPRPAQNADKVAAKERSVEPVIPLVHAPDDPGPEAGSEGDPVREAASAPAGDTWQRIRQLFR